MKIRQGFVSNSSSSSFIVVWDKQPTSVDEVKKILFGNAELQSYYDYTIPTDKLAKIVFNDTTEMDLEQLKEYISETYQLWESQGKYSWYSTGYKADPSLLKEYEDWYIKTHQRVEFLEKKLEKETTKETRKKKLSRVLNEEVEESEWDRLNNERIELQQQLWSSDKMDKLINDSVEKFLKDNEGKFISHYEYSDNEGEVNCTLEHGGTFDNLEHIRISHH